MILEQHYLGCLAQASYLIGDAAAGVAAVVDPRRDVDLYLESAASHGVEIRHVLLTHFHADFVAGHIELAKRTGAKIWLGAAADASYDFGKLADGDELELGSVRIRALATPGHTPESTCYLVFDGDAADPHAVLTGDTLFIGDVGRPDLMASVGVTAQELGAQLYDSLRDKLLPLPDATLVYPGHGAGSMCGKNLSSDTVSTVGDQRAHNYALQPMSRDEFVALVASGQPRTPRYFPEDARMNREERETLDTVVTRGRRELDLDEALRLQNGGAVVLDCRDAESFARGHLAGSIWVGLDGKFATWAGTVLRHEDPVILVADANRFDEAATRLGRIGHDRLEGRLDAAAFRERSELLAKLPRTDVPGLQHELDGVTVLDVRGPGEWEAGHIDGATHIPLIELEERLSEVPRGDDVRVICGSGYRSLIATSMLLRAGMGALTDVRGGMTAWDAACV